MMKGLFKLARHPRVTIAASFAMIGSAIWDLLEIPSKAFLGFELGAEHGVIIVGLVHLAKAFADLDEGAEKLEESEKAEKKLKAARGNASTSVAPSKSP